MQWKCLPCPVGGDCRGNVRWQDVQPIFGYFRLHAIDTCADRRIETSFWPCFKPDACLGARNPKLEGRYFSDLVNESRVVGHTIDLAATEINLIVVILTMAMKITLAHLKPLSPLW